MAQMIADRRDIDFVLYEQLKTDEMTNLDKYLDFNKKTFDMVIIDIVNHAPDDGNRDSAFDKENQRPPAELRGMRMVPGRSRGHLCWWPLIQFISRRH